MKIGVLIVAYNAESTLIDVLDRIPQTMRDAITEILVHDDHSADGTFAVATQYAEDQAHLPLTLIRHQRNLGYGGNQKAGYRYALDHGWDIVVLLHGDGQYAPENLADIVAPLLSGSADAVFGSRMMERGSARRGGMPAYKYLGNRILSTFQNSLTGLTLSEWHSGYRAYRVTALDDIALFANSDGFDFDTEIILQLHAAGKHIVEVPIPTYYGDEICYVNGLSYARDVAMHTVRHRLGRRGFGSGALGRTSNAYEFKPSDQSSHTKVLAMVPRQAGLRVLDVGCGAGFLAELLRKRGQHVVGIDVSESPEVASRVDRFCRCDLDLGLTDDVGSGYDVIVAADVLEHVRKPDALLVDLSSRLASHGEIVVSIPNFGHWYPRVRTLLGLFDYDQRGILDNDHVRLFTRRSFKRLLHRAGLQVMSESCTGLPLDVLRVSSDRGAGRLLARLDAFAVSVWPTMFAYQFVFSLQPRRDSLKHAATDLDAE